MGKRIKKPQLKLCQYKGYISGDSKTLHQEEMTIESALAKAETISGCAGFCFAGPPTPSHKTTIWFKGEWNLHRSEEEWTSYRVQEMTVRHSKWISKQGLPQNEGKDNTTIGGGVCSSLDEVMRLCESADDCIGFAYCPQTKKYYPKSRGTGFDSTRETYLQRRH